MQLLSTAELELSLVICDALPQLVLEGGTMTKDGACDVFVHPLRSCWRSFGVSVHPSWLVDVAGSYPLA